METLELLIYLDFLETYRTMEKVILTIGFMSGLIYSVDQWKRTILIWSQIATIQRRGFRPDDYPHFYSALDEKPTEIEIVESKKEAHKMYIIELAKSVYLQMNYALFVSIITIILLLFIFN